MRNTTASSVSSDNLLNRAGFTIVELLIVIVVIGILTAIGIVSYNGVQNRAIDVKTKSDVSNAGKMLRLHQVREGAFPVGTIAPEDLRVSEGVELMYTSDGSAFSLTGYSASNDSIAYCITNQASSPKKGSCDGHDIGSVDPPVDPGGDEEPEIAYMQDATNSNCPTTRTLMVDARDNHTYWVQKFGSDCWMVTNLAYDGGGDDSHGDVKSLQLGGALTVTSARYYKDSGSSFTSYPSEPSTSTNGSGQHGYLYNYCAALGGQSPACRESGTTSATTPNPSISICPAGWSMPTANDYDYLIDAINATDNEAGHQRVLNQLLGQHAGYW